MSSEEDEADASESATLPGGDFTHFVARLNIHGLMSMGVLENPLTHKSHTNLDQARMLVLDLEMLLEKTRGNISDMESSHLQKVASDLRHLYDSKVTK